MEDIGLGLVSLLRATWFFSTLPIVVGWVPLPGIGWLHEIMLGFAKRGKILQDKTKLSVPQRTFTHFYAVGILWTTILLVAVWFYAITRLPTLNDDQRDPSSSSAITPREHVYNVWQSTFMLLLMEAQVLRRFYESNFVFNYSPSARMHIVGYLVGIFYYIAAPLSLCCNVAPEVFEFVKSRVWRGIVKENKEEHIIMSIIPDQFDIWPVFFTPFLSLQWYAWIGAAIFLWGWIHQFRCHVILGSLRKKTEKMEGYIIPYGDWFEYTSSAHYTAEIVMYGGLVVASGGADLSLWLLFAFVVANLGFAASITHRWYLQKFDDYPSSRCAIFPFVY